MRDLKLVLWYASMVLLIICFTIAQLYVPSNKWVLLLLILAGCGILVFGFLLWCASDDAAEYSGIM